MPPVKPQPAKLKGSSSNYNKIFALAIVGAAAIGAIAYFVYPYIDKKTGTTIYVLPPADSIKTQVDSTSVTIEEKPQITTTVESSSSVAKGCYIIVGSYRNKANADRMVENLRKDIDLAVLYFDNLGVYRVSAGRYDELRKAYNDTYSIKDIDGCANAWVLENR